MSDNIDAILHEAPDQDINVKIEYIFGLRQDLYQNIYAIDADFILYAAANYIIIYNHTLKSHRKAQQFIPGSLHSNGIKALTFAKYSKNYVFYVEDLNPKWKVTAYSLINISPYYNCPTKLMDYIFEDNMKITEIYCIAASSQETGSLICVPVKTDIFSIVMWRWESETLREMNTTAVILPKQEFSFLNVKFSQDYTKMDYFVLYTDEFFSYFSFNNGSLAKHFEFIDEEKKYGNGKILDAEWLPDGKWAILTNTDLVIFNLDKKTVVSTIDLERKNCKITGIQSFYDALILTGTNKRLEYWENKQEWERVFCTNFEGYSDFNFKCMSYSSSEDQSIIATTNKNDVFTISFEKYLNYDDSRLNKESSNEDEIKKQIEKRDKNSLKALLPSFHTGSIDALDICINKPYIITGSKDQSLRIYNYLEKKLHLSKQFQEDILSVAFHPSGNYAIISNEERLRPLHIFYDVIENMTQNGIPSKKSKDIRFSHGGHLFSFEAGNRVEIWNFLTLQLHQSLKFVFSTSKVSN